MVIAEVNMNFSFCAAVAPVVPTNQTVEHPGSTTKLDTSSIALLKKNDALVYEPSMSLMSRESLRSTGGRLNRGKTGAFWYVYENPDDTDEVLKLPTYRSCARRVNRGKRANISKTAKIAHSEGLSPEVKDIGETANGTYISEYQRVMGKHR